MGARMETRAELLKAFKRIYPDIRLARQACHELTAKSAAWAASVSESHDDKAYCEAEIVRQAAKLRWTTTREITMCLASESDVRLCFHSTPAPKSSAEVVHCFVRVFAL